MQGFDALFEVMKERNRQVAHGFTAAHDDGHADGSILNAAGWILNDVEGGTHSPDDADDDAPWAERLAGKLIAKHAGDKPRLLVIAAAMIVAEAERIARAAAPK